MSVKRETVVVLGASDDPDRYSNKAVRLLKEYGHHVIPVNPNLSEIEGFPVLPELGAVTAQVDTLTVYLSPTRTISLIDDILRLQPDRVILNPGTESDVLERRLTDEGIRFEKGCTLVLLKTGQF